MDKPSLIITGPTACGKTRRGVEVAKALGCEIISADSRQVYRGMDLGTGKDLDDYEGVPYHMIDVVDAGYRYNLYEYLRDYRVAIDRISERGVRGLVVGGTGLYVESIARGVQLPEVPVNPGLRATLSGKSLAELTEILADMKTLHNTTDVDTAKRAIRAIEIEEYYREHPEAANAKTKKDAEEQVPVIVLEIGREERRQRISKRLMERLDNGMIDEVQGLIAQGVSTATLLYYGLEYKFITLYLTDKLSYDEMVSGLETAIHQFAKRQMTWFRGMERRGCKLHWMPYNADNKDLVDLAQRLTDGTIV